MQFFNFIALLLYSYISYLPPETITPWQLPQVQQPGILQPACVASLGVLHGESGPEAKEIWLKTAESPPNWQSITTISSKNQEYLFTKINVLVPPLCNIRWMFVLCVRYVVSSVTSWLFCLSKAVSRVSRTDSKLCTWKLAIFPFKIWRLKPWPQHRKESSKLLHQVRMKWEKTWQQWKPKFSSMLLDSGQQQSTFSLKYIQKPRLVSISQSHELLLGSISQLVRMHPRVSYRNECKWRASGTRRKRQDCFASKPRNVARSGCRQISDMYPLASPCLERQLKSTMALYDWYVWQPIEHWWNEIQMDTCRCTDHCMIRLQVVSPESQQQWLKSSGIVRLESQKRTKKNLWFIKWILSVSSCSPYFPILSHTSLSFHDRKLSQTHEIVQLLREKTGVAVLDIPVIKLECTACPVRLIVPGCGDHAQTRDSRKTAFINHAYCRARILSSTFVILYRLVEKQCLDG